jgi:GNAT superfamily N-acetyltransferase
VHESVRQARAPDIPALALLLEAARHEAAPRRGGALLLSGGGAGPLRTVDDEQEPLVALAAWMQSPTRVVVSGLIDDVVVGLASGHLVTTGAETLGVVDCCYVDAEARQVGVGASMAARLVEWFKDNGCVGVDVPALPGDRSTKQLWETAGFSARLLVLHRPLE